MLSIIALSSPSLVIPAAKMAPAVGAGRLAAPVKMQATSEYAKTLPGAGPFGFFDPFGFTSAEFMNEGRVRYFREVELKHGRVAMLGALGFLIAEQFHPLFGGDIDVPSYIAYQQTPLQTFWPVVVASIGVIEFFSIVSIENSFEVKATYPDGKPRTAGDFLFDPLGLKPSDPAALVEMQEKELNNGRLAMIAMAGMVAQELVTGSKLF